MDTKTWFSYHLFTTLDRNEILITQVKDILNLFQEKKLIDRFFYIRYNEGGKHLRLRFEGFFHSEQEIEKSIQDYFPTDNFKIRKEAYQPETVRYGGKETLFIAEQHFQLSSEVCLIVLDEKPDDLLSRAVILHFSLAKASGKTSSELIQLFDNYIQHWFLHSGLSKENQDIKEVMKTYFEPRYTEMKHGDFFQTLSDTFASGEHTGICWIDQWYKGNKSLLHQLNLLLNTASYFSVLESLMHMTNNRLGIKNYEESFLAYLLKRILEDEQLLTDYSLSNSKI